MNLGRTTLIQVSEPTSILINKPSREKINIMASASNIDPDQTDPGRNIPSQGDRGIE